jgi:hypothetical protein
MNNWNFVLILAVLIELLWILSNVFRSKEEEREKEQSPRRSDRIERPRQRTPSTNVDRFLEEINRRRREAAERQARGPTVSPPRTEPVSPTDVPPRRRVLEAAQAPRQAPTRLRPRPQTDLRRIPQVEAVVETAEPVPMAQVDTVAPGALAQAAAAFLATSVPVRPRSRMLTEVLPLIQSKRALPLAIVLNEIFGPPLCRRGRRHIRPQGRPSATSNRPGTAYS